MAVRGQECGVKRDIVDAAAGQPQAASLFTTSRVQNT
jgi:hypothetical protein